MDLQSQSDRLNPNYEEALRLHSCWAWFLILGIVVMLIGVAAIVYDFLATLTTVLVFGILLLGGGIVELVNAFLARSWRAFFLHLLVGILHLIIGMLMIQHPERAAEVLTLLLAVAFLAGGAFRILYALLERFPGSAWVLLNGIITLLLGIMIWRRWPEASYWVIGLFVGIDLIFSGWSWVMLGLLVKDLSPKTLPTQPSDSMPAGAGRN
jgi:uncharacterized membrane protein HdeD (DUF308 family)